MKNESIDGLGDVTYIKRKNTRNINVKIEPYGKLKVSMPHNIPYYTARNFILKNKQHILSKLDYLNDKLTQFDHTSQFHTMWHELKINGSECLKTYYRINSHSTVIYYPNNSNIFEPEVQNKIREAINETLRTEAKIYLPQRLKQLALKHRFHYNKVFLKNMKTLWGSCSYRNNINLNIHLMRLPRRLTDYIILHELTHTIFKNHGPQFWKLLESILDSDINSLKEELRKFSPQIY